MKPLPSSVDILLIQPPIRDFYLTAKRTLPYGLACIASALEAEGFSVAILDALATSKSRVIERPAEMAYLEPYFGRPDVSPFALFHRYRHYGLDFEALGAAAKACGAFLVGISSLFTAYAGEALATAEAVKRHHPEAVVVLGGHHPTELPEAVMECRAVDYVLRGEGEASLPRLARAIRGGQCPADVPGLVSRPFARPAGRHLARPVAVTVSMPVATPVSIPGSTPFVRPLATSFPEPESVQPSENPHGLDLPPLSEEAPLSFPPFPKTPIPIPPFSEEAHLSIPPFPKGGGGDFRESVHTPNATRHPPAPLAGFHTGSIPENTDPVRPDSAAKAGDTGVALSIRPPAVMEDLDKTPLPAVHLLDLGFYSRKKRAAIVVTASRGCPLRCSYCSVGARSAAPYRRRSVASVMDEIEAYARQGEIGFIDFEDENISLERRWFLDFLAIFEARFGGRGIELRAMNGLFPPSLDPEVIGAMRSAGFRTLNLSLGTTSVEQQRRFGRPDLRGAFDAAAREAEALDMEAVGYIIAGAPGQSPEESVDDLLFLAERPVIAGVSVFYPAPGSADYAVCRERGLLPATHALHRGSALPLSDVTTRDDAATLLRLGRMLNFLKSLAAKAGNAPQLPPRSVVVLPPQSTADPHEEIPTGRHMKPTPPRVPLDRTPMGLALVRQFLEDGIIRGITPEGRPYAHVTALPLARRFIAGLDSAAERHPPLRAALEAALSADPPPSMLLN